MFRRLSTLSMATQSCSATRTAHSPLSRPRAGTSVEAVIAYDRRDSASTGPTLDLADRMASLVQEGKRRGSAEKLHRTGLHPDGIEDLDADAEWPVLARL